MPSPEVSDTGAGAETVNAPGPLPVATMPAKAYADGAVSTPPPKANPAARAAKEAPPDKLIPSGLCLETVDEDKELGSANWGRMVNNLLVLKW